MMVLRFAGWAMPGAFVLLMGAMASFGLIPSSQGVWLSLGVVAAFGPSGWLQPHGWRRRAAEALLLPAAASVVLIPSPVITQMIVAPLLALAAWAAWSAAVRRVPGRSGRVVLTAFFGVAVRLILGFASLPGGWVGASGAIAASAIVPGALAALSAPLGLVAAMLTLPLTIQSGPGVTWSLVVLGLALTGLLGRSPLTERSLENCTGWYPGVGGAFLVVVAIGAWGLPDVSGVLPGINWIGGGIAIIILASSVRLPPPTAGACTLLVCLLIGPPLVPTPEGGGLTLDRDHGQASLRPGIGSPYILDIKVDNLDKVRENGKIVTIEVGSKRVALRSHRGSDGRLGTEIAQQNAVCGKQSLEVLRAAPHADRGWRSADRIVLEVPEGVVPVIERRAALPEDVVVQLLVSGPAKPVPPRMISAERWIWLTAAAVALIQLLSGLWRRRDAWPSWMLLAAGLIACRVAVEPLHLIIERHGVDLCLTALLITWVPAAIGWVKRGWVFLAVAAFLVPMALATSHLTPPLWGDEPYHIALAQSFTEDLDFDLANNLEGGGAVREIVLSSNRLFHSPILVGLLLPGFLIAGRTGALVLLALAGAWLVSLVVRRYREMRAPPDRAVVLLVLIACMTYPLVTFSTQIWPALLGALVIAATLLLVTRGRWARFSAAALALVAVAAKTRLALVTFPIVATGWWRGNSKARMTGALVVGAAAIGAAAIGWLTMGHPFGYYRRLHHLLPTDPALALRVVSGLFFDVAGGLAWTAPLWLLAVAALPLLWRRGGDGERALLLGGAATVLALLHSIEWYGGGSPPGRYLIPLLPAVLLALGMLISQPDGRRRLLAFLAPAALFPWWAVVTRPHFSINPGDGRWWLTNSLSRRFAAEARALFPSFLTPGTATLVVPVILIGLAAFLWWFCRSPRRAWWLGRLGPAVWLIAALGLVVAVNTRADTVVEVESAQVKRRGGEPVPAIGTPTRFAQPNGWKLGGGDGLIIPLNLRGGEDVEIEARVTPPGWSGSLDVTWDDGSTTEFSVHRGPEVESIVVPGPSERGRHRLFLRWSDNKQSELFVDRVVVTRR